jgi:hypothetical protein
MAETWQDRLRTIGQSLLTLEINTVVTTGLSAQKMPEVPLALHTLVQTYGDYLATAGFQVTRGLLRKSASRVGGLDEAGTNEGATKLLRELERWPFANRKFTSAEQLAPGNAPDPDSRDQLVEGDNDPAPDLTNGAETFEALQWAAWGALQTVRAGGTLTGNYDSAVLSRIYANCRQLKEAARRLEQQHETPAAPRHFFARQTSNGGTAASDGRLRGSLTARTAEENRARTVSRLFGATVEQTARALFDHPRPVFDVDPDVMILIRKAWDVGVQRVCLQTVMQVDGDLLQVIGDLRNDERDFLTRLHTSAARDATTQWHALFDVVRQLAGDLGKVVFGA